MSLLFARAALEALQVGRRFGPTDEGQDLLEYALLVALIAIVAVGAVGTVGNTINTVFWSAIAAASLGAAA